MKPQENYEADKQREIDKLKIQEAENKEKLKN